MPVIAPQFDPLVHSCSTDSKLSLIKLAAFEATYQDSVTPLSPDMFPLVLDTGARITVTPYRTDFTSPILPVQRTEIKGIASGLQVAGIGTPLTNSLMTTETYKPLLFLTVSTSLNVPLIYYALDKSDIP